MTAWQGSTRAKRLPRGWAKLRTRILERDGYRCTRTTNGVRCNQRATEVDHILRGDDHRPTNLASLCPDHHRQKTQAEATAARWAHRTERQPEQRPNT